MEEYATRHHNHIDVLQKHNNESNSTILELQNKLDLLSKTTNETPETVKAKPGPDAEAFSLLLKKLATLEQTVESQWNTIENLSQQKAKLLSQISSDYTKSNVYLV
jgi:prefoldin subunit 5